jgi:uncharacterized protein (DUF433 family)
MNYRNYISINPSIRFGKPCITGTRITVSDVLSWLSNDMSIREIIKDFPELKEEHIKACLAYAAEKERKLKVAIA